MKVEIEGLGKTINGNQILKGIDLCMASGNIYGLKGKNGSGKTMLMRALCGLIRPTEGVVKVDGEILGKDISFPRSVGVLIENPGFINQYTAYQNLKILTSIKKQVGDERIEEVLHLVGLDEAKKKPFKKYSLGMKQKLGIAAAIVEDPDLIILDEPTNALDEASVKILKEIIVDLKQRGKLVVLSSHDTEELEYLSDIMIQIENGEIKDIKDRQRETSFVIDE